MTPGRSLPGNAIGRSSAPVATTTRLARMCQSRSRTSPAGGRRAQVVGAPLHGDDVARVVDPDRGRAHEHARLVGRREPPPRAPDQSSAGPPSISSPGAPSSAPPSSRVASSSAVRAPVEAAASAAATPAGPPPITSTSQCT
jgi:hypothetical protein